MAADQPPDPDCNTELERTDRLPVLAPAATEVPDEDEPTTLPAPWQRPAPVGLEATQPRLPVMDAVAADSLAAELETLRVALKVERLRGAELVGALEQARRARREADAQDAAAASRLADYAALQARLAEREAALAEAGASILTLEQRHATLAAELESLRQLVPPPVAEQQLEPLREQINALQSSIAEHEVEREGWRQARDAAFADVQRLSLELGHSTQALAAAQAQAALLGAELADARARVADREATLAMLQQALAQLQADAEARAAPAAPPADAATEPTLIPLDGAPPGAFRIGARTRIGRADDNDMRLDASAVSRHHAVVISSAHGVFVEDLNSVNGVYVNRKRVRHARLIDGDVLGLGTVSFRYTGPATAVADR